MAMAWRKCGAAIGYVMAIYEMCMIVMAATSAALVVNEGVA